MRDPYLRRPHVTPDEGAAVIVTIAGVCACILLAVAAVLLRQLIG